MGGFAIGPSGGRSGERLTRPGGALAAPKRCPSVEAGRGAREQTRKGQGRATHGVKRTQLHFSPCLREGQLRWRFCTLCRSIGDPARGACRFLGCRCPNPAKTGPNLAEPGPISAELGPNLPNSGQTRPELGHVRPNSAKCGLESTKCEKEIVRFRQRLTRHRPSVGGSRPHLARAWPKSTRTESSNVARSWPTLANIGPGWPEVSVKSLAGVHGQLRRTLARKRPNIATAVDQTLPSLGRDLGPLVDSHGRHEERRAALTAHGQGATRKPWVRVAGIAIS